MFQDVLTRNNDDPQSRNEGFGESVKSQLMTDTLITSSGLTNDLTNEITQSQTFAKGCDLFL